MLQFIAVLPDFLRIVGGTFYEFTDESFAFVLLEDGFVETYPFAVLSIFGFAAAAAATDATISFRFHVVGNFNSTFDTTRSRRQSNFFQWLFYSNLRKEKREKKSL